MTGFFSFGPDGESDALFDFGADASAGGQRARNTFSDLQTVRIRSMETYSALLEFASCPNPRGLNNCVMDDKFVAAIQQATSGSALSVQGAIEQGLLNGNWPLIPQSDKARNQDPYCYTFGYCYSNLVKLRHARILPVGFELAANSEFNSPGDPVSLQEVVNSFSNCNDENLPDADHPWCHLIDPNWILKYPESQCRAMVPGPTLLSKEADTRAETCVDAPACVTTDDDGNCQGYGYCTRERNIWRFDGGECPAYYSSCLSMSGPENKQLNLLTSTVDFGTCNMENTGCRWYSTVQSYVDLLDSDDAVCSGGLRDGLSCNRTNGDVDCTGGGACVVRSVRDTVVWSNNENSRLYLNGKTQTCDAQNAGCTELIRKQSQQIDPATGQKRETSLNLLRNSSFETNTDSVADYPDFWVGDAPALYGHSSNGALNSSSAVRLSNDKLYQRILVEPGKTYNMSLYAKQGTSGAAAGLKIILFKDNYSAQSVFDQNNDGTSEFYIGETCVLSTVNSVSVSGNTSGGLFTPTNEYTRRSCTFTTPSDARIALVEISGSSSGTGVWVDAVKLEENEIATPYGEGYVGDQEKVNLKLSPPELCTGGNDDPLICSQYAQVCSATEVGCQLYTPKNGDAPITGIAKTADQCHASCVGYETFREEPTSFNPSGKYPVYFIPSTARSCGVASAGCDEFTNMENESKEYFTFLRACELPDETAATYYTWESSERDGFQLRVWNLKKSNIASSTLGVADPTGGNAPCTKYSAQTGNCIDNVADTAPTDCNERLDIFRNPDCREFHDAAGNIHYRLFSKTVVKTDSCTNYRKTESDIISCMNSGGRWQGATNQCFYSAETSSSRTCGASENLCRLYTGNAGRNTRIYFEDDFENTSLRAGWLHGTISNESLATSGHSVKRGAATDLTYDFGMVTRTDFNDQTFMISFWARGTENAALGVKIGDSSASNLPGGAFTSSAKLTSGWSYYEYGPVKVNFNATSTSTNPAVAQAAIAAAQTAVNPYLRFETSSSGNDVFIDNIVLKRVAENIAVIRDSWNTPAECNATLEGAYSPQEMLGCKTYTDKIGNTLHLRSFSSLCREGAVGCEAFFNTQNSSSLYAKTWNYICAREDGNSGDCYVDPDGDAVVNGISAERVFACTIASGNKTCAFAWDGELVDSVPGNDYSGIDSTLPYKYVDGTRNLTGAATDHVLPFFYGPDLKVVPADKTVYAVDSPEARCSSDQKGCTLLGLPSFNQDNTVVDEFTDKTFLNLPDQYENILCTDEALFCGTWETNNGSKYFFKDPLDKQCEYRQTASSTLGYGWFKKGTDEPCYANYQTGLNEKGIWTNSAVCALAGATTNASRNCPLGTADDSPARQCVVLPGQTSCTPYQGWAGICQEQYSTCTQFQDPFDVGYEEETGYQNWPTGKPYTYLNNQTLDDAAQRPTRQCNGQASLEEGCVLFNDPTDPILRYNSGATYLKSREEGQFSLKAGQQKFMKVDPVDCFNPAPDDAKYCNTCSTLSIQLGGAPLPPPPPASYCSGGNIYRLATPVHFNDSNVVLSVKRDRECSQWLACDSPQQVWDPQQSAWRTVCTSLDLCNGPAAVQDLTSCKYVAEKPKPTVFNNNIYTGRSIGWFGEDYTGYTIPGLFPLDALEPVNVGACVSEDLAGSTKALLINEDVYGLDAAADFSCNSDSDCSVCSDGSACLWPGTCSDGSLCTNRVCVDHFRLGRIFGTCNGDAGTACTVSRCSISGKQCKNDCNSGEGVCNLYGSGACYNGQCAAAPAGASMNDGNSEGALCRAYPESNSPFPNETVESWGFNGVPAQTKDGFQNVQFCSRDEACECSYQKATYGSGNNRYFGINTADGNIPVGICVGGPNEGKECNGDGQCNDTDDIGDERDLSNDFNQGTCEIMTRKDQFIGLPGFCLEEDKSVSINGNPNKFACLTWYPVDQIAGAPDLNNQFTGAGYVAASGQEWYCAEGSWNTTAHPFAPPYLQEPVIDITYNSGDSWKYFGPVNNVSCTPQGATENPNTWDNLYSCIGVHHERIGAINCADAAGGAWCLWPQQECLNSVWDDSRVQQSGTQLCHTPTHESGMPSDQFDDSGPLYQDGGNNFLGCYELADGIGSDLLDDWPGSKANGIGFMRWPWRGPDIYKWQIREFEVTVKDSDSAVEDDPVNPVDQSDGLCSRYTSENSDGFFPPSFTETTKQFTFDVGTTESSLESGLQLNVGEDEDNSKLGMYPVWDSDERLRAITMIADDGGDEAQFFINEFKIYFWPACAKVANVGLERSSAAFTDRVKGVDFDYMIDNGFANNGLYEEGGTQFAEPFNQNTANGLWGAISDFIVDQDWIMVVDDPNSEGGTKQTDALYRSPESLAKLFARSNEVRRWEWQGTNNVAERIVLLTSLSLSNIIEDYIAQWRSWDHYKITDDDQKWDVTEDEVGIIPQVRGTLSCDIENICEGTPSSGMTVNNQTSGDVAGANGQLRTVVKFFAWADKNQMPITDLSVDWGDGDNLSGGIGSYKNHKAVCDDPDDAEDQTVWGNTPDSCENKPFQFTHDYKCNNAILGRLPSCTSATPHISFYEPGGCKDAGRCVYTPRVFVKDNWGWCTGTCLSGNTENNTSGCYDASLNTVNYASSARVNECDTNLPVQNNPTTLKNEAEIDPWVYYAGRVMVSPEE